MSDSKITRIPTGENRRQFEIKSEMKKFDDAFCRGTGNDPFWKEYFAAVETLYGKYEIGSEEYKAAKEEVTRPVMVKYGMTAIMGMPIDELCSPEQLKRITETTERLERRITELREKHSDDSEK